MTTPIQSQPTPNPNARKYILPAVRFATSTNYASVEAAAHVPWIRALFELEGVYNVFTAQNFVTVNKRSTVDWEPLEAQICARLVEAFPPDDTDPNTAPPAATTSDQHAAPRAK